MTVKMSEQTRLQADLLGRFLASLEKVKSDIVELARDYKACIDGGIDMSAYCDKSLAFRLTKIAEGKLLPEAHTKLLGNDSLVVAMASLPVEKQKQLLTEGVPIVRDGKPTVVPAEDVRPSEARRILDPVSKRLLPPEEQAAREQHVPVKRHDMPVTLNFNREDYNDIAAQAKRARQSLHSFLLAELVKSGVLRGDKNVA